MIEQLRKFNLGMPNGLVKLKPHEAHWIEAFSFIESNLISRLSCQIELYHVGSTSIPSIAAKPIIDVIGVVSRLDDFDRCRSQVESLGFAWMDDYGIPSRRYCPLYDETKEIAFAHLHVFERANKQVENHLIFSQFLRAFPLEAREYERVKLELAMTSPTDRGAYTNGKFDCIAGILKRAFDWKSKSETILRL